MNFGLYGPRRKTIGKGPDIYIPQLTGKSKQQRVTIRSFQPYASNRQTDRHIWPPIFRINVLWTPLYQLDRPIYAPASRTMAYNVR